MSKYLSYRRLRGFTIVELVIVIVIIGILSTIAVISFTEFRKNAEISAIKSGLTATSVNLNDYFRKHGEYPTKMPQNSISPLGNYEYVGTTAGYCVKATSKNYEIDPIYMSDRGFVDQTRCNDDFGPLADTVFEFNTASVGCNAARTVRLPINQPSDSSGNVDWGDGVTEPVNQSNKSHTYAAAGTYTVRYRGPVNIVSYMSGVNSDQAKCLTKITQWGVIAFPTKVDVYGAANFVAMADLPGSVTDISNILYGATAFNQLIGGWDTSNVTNMSNAFYGASSFNQSLAAWKTSKVTSMFSMFYGATNFAGDVSTWDTSNVTNMANMFSGATAFNSNLNNWGVANVTNMTRMFYGAKAFASNIASWNTRNVTNMSYMFSGASAFNSNISTWSTANVTTMQRMFDGANQFNSPINYSSVTGAWNTSKVQSMEGMFANTALFNQPIDAWNTSNVTNMSWMFGYSQKFNQNINSWDVSQVTTMYFMFASNAVFAQPLALWNVGNVTNFGLMFSGAQAFNQPLNNWGAKTSKATNMSGMFRWSYYNQPLNTWDTSSVTDMSQMFYHDPSLYQNFSMWSVPNVTNHTDFDGYYNTLPASYLPHFLS